MAENSPRPQRVVVLGGYGHFGGRICRALAVDGNIKLIVAGRDQSNASAFVRTLKGGHEAAQVDCTDKNLPQRLRELCANIVVHTCGPFQGQGYHVAQSCIEAGAHYVDLADGREFVAGIAALDEAARAVGVLVISGASTLPALSSAVIDEYLGEFSRLDSIDISIAPGQRTPRGLATMQAVLCYCGKPFSVWRNGRWQTAHGWQGLRRHDYQDFGARWGACCDVPDLQLFPVRYAGVRDVQFDAALELLIGQSAFWLIAWLTRMGLLSDPKRLAAIMQRCGVWFDALGSDVGGMHVGLRGLGRDGRERHLDWHLVARRGHGPEIPCVPAIVMARKLAAGAITQRGAMPCMGLMLLADFAQAVSHLDIAWTTVPA